MRTWLLTLLIPCFGLSARADEVSICYNYGCAVTAQISLQADKLNAARRLLLQAEGAAAERAAISRVIGLFEVAAGQQTPTWADKGRNVNDDGVDGRMDCIVNLPIPLATCACLKARAGLRTTAYWIR